MITITINTDSDAFQDDFYGELSQILRSLTDKHPDEVFKLRYINGNTVGEVKIS